VLCSVICLYSVHRALCTVRACLTYVSVVQKLFEPQHPIYRADIMGRGRGRGMDTLSERVRD
jgi:hypothetical protein